MPAQTPTGPEALSFMDYKHITDPCRLVLTLEGFKFTGAGFNPVELSIFAYANDTDSYPFMQTVYLDTCTVVMLSLSLPLSF